MPSAKGVSDGDNVEQPGVVTELRRTSKSRERHPKKWAATVSMIETTAAQALPKAALVTRAGS
jgi:hypothetical protein